MHAATLLDAFSRLDDPRSPRGVRHPFAGMVVLMLLGMLARIREMEVLVRWATIHRDRLQEPLGFDRAEPLQYYVGRNAENTANALRAVYERSKVNIHVSATETAKGRRESKAANPYGFTA